MTQDEIMELVRQAGGTFGSHIAWVERDLMPVYIRFAHLVAEKEREACVRIAESKRHASNFQLTSMPPQNGTAVDIANLIRAREQ